MTTLTALTRLYDRLADAETVPRFGYSTEKIAYCIVLDAAGAVREVIDLRHHEDKKKPQPRLIAVPQSFKRPGTTPRPFFLWDNTMFVLGVTGDEKKDPAGRHAAFKACHADLLAGTDDPGLVALRTFLETWTPDQFTPPLFPDAMRDTNVVFRLQTDQGFLHQRPAAGPLWSTCLTDADGAEGICLVTGERAPIARTHPAIKGVLNAQTSGGSIVSFNFDALESYGHQQGGNAPVSVASAFAYTTALNHMLARDSHHRVQIGDATTVFWAEAEDAETAAIAEQAFSFGLGVEINPDTAIAPVRAILEGMAQGLPLSRINPRIEAARFYVLGLSPNQARLSVRFWLEDSFGRIAEHIGAHARDLRLQPPPRQKRPSPWHLLVEAAVQRKSDNIPPQLGGELMRAILTGRPYPATLLTTLLMRLRGDSQITALRVALLKAIVARAHRLAPHPTTEDPPVALDPDNTDPGYLLGRLFALYEGAQHAALPSIKATVKDKFYGAASSTPQSVFPLIDRGSAAHLTKLRKEKPGLAYVIEQDIAAVMARMSPGETPFPRSLPPDQQALFALGYYHQRFHRAGSADTADPPDTSDAPANGPPPAA